MTFEQIENSQEVYVNSFGVVFTAIPDSEMMVAYQLDSKVTLSIIKPVQTLYIVFNSPDKIDFIKLKNYIKLHNY